MHSRRHSSILRKIFLLFASFAVVNILLFLAIIFENQIELISENATLTSRMTATDIRTTLEGMGVEKIPQSGKRLRKQFKFTSLRIVTPDFKTLYSHPDSGTEPVTEEDRKAITRTLFKQEFEDKSFHQKIDTSRRHARLFVPVIDKKTILVAIINLPLHTFTEQFNLLIRQAIVGGVLIILAYIALILFTSRLIIRPLRKLKEATQLIARGELNTRVQIVRNDELGELAINFNEMASDLLRLNEKAKSANPLSGLPGNVEIVDTVLSMMTRKSKFAVLYCDLDNFKAYNDTYGFVRGDDVILYTRDILNKAVSKLSLDECFVGHEGGDDFVLITTPEHYERLAETIIEMFDDGIKQFYTKQDQKKGYIEAYNREGQYRRFRFVSISIGIVTNIEVDFDTYPEIISIAAEMKKHAKATNGSSYSVNRRKQ